MNSSPARASGWERPLLELMAALFGWRGGPQKGDDRFLSEGGTDLEPIWLAKSVIRGFSCYDFMHMQPGLNNMEKPLQSISDHLKFLYIALMLYRAQRSLGRRPRSHTWSGFGPECAHSGPRVWRGRLSGGRGCGLLCKLQVSRLLIPNCLTASSNEHTVGTHLCGH